MNNSKVTSTGKYVDAERPHPTMKIHNTTSAAQPEQWGIQVSRAARIVYMNDEGTQVKYTRNDGTVSCTSLYRCRPNEPNDSSLGL